MMTHSNETVVVELKITDAAPDATKDAGRVHIGGGLMHFGDIASAREATKDAGRVHIGGGLLRF